MIFDINAMSQFDRVMTIISVAFLLCVICSLIDKISKIRKRNK